MIIDANLLFSKDQTITTDAASTKVVDQGSVSGRPVPTPPGAGEPYYDAIGGELTYHVIASVGFTCGSNDTIQIKIQTSSDNSNWSDLVLSPAIKVNGVAAGTELFSVRQVKGVKRYIRLFYDVTVASAITAGKITAFANRDR